MSNPILSFLFSLKGLIILGVIVLIIVLISVIKRANKKKNYNKGLMKAAEDKARDDNLNGQILNTKAGVQSKRTNLPYEVDYSGVNGKDNHTPPFSSVQPGAVMIEVIEQTQFSKRKFIQNASAGTRIGTSSEDNIPFMCEDGSVYEVEIIAIGSELIARNLIPSSRVCIRRKKEQAILDANGIKIKTGDIVMMDKYSYIITRIGNV